MKKIATLLVFAGLSFVNAASATTITFSEVGAENSRFLSADGQVKVEYVWSIGFNDGHSHLNSNNPSNPYEQGHGQAYQGLRFSSVDAGSLTLNSFDFQGNWTVSGLNDGTGTAYSTSFGSWSTQNVNLTSSNPIYIYANNGSGYLDNVVFNSANDVPEPATAALILLGMAGLLSMRKKAAK